MKAKEPACGRIVLKDENRDNALRDVWRELENRFSDYRAGSEQMAQAFHEGSIGEAFAEGRAWAAGELAKTVWRVIDDNSYGGVGSEPEE